VKHVFVIVSSRFYGYRGKIRYKATRFLSHAFVQKKRAILLVITNSD
jgi:hypothetical protein